MSQIPVITMSEGLLFEKEHVRVLEKVMNLYPDSDCVQFRLIQGDLVHSMMIAVPEDAVFRETKVATPQLVLGILEEAWKVYKPYVSLH